jgi:hypothetical protein
MQLRHWLAAGACALLVGGVLAAQTTTPTLPAAQQCEVDRVALQEQVVQLRAQLVAAQTQIDRQALAAERARIEGTLPKVDGQRWDWTSLRYVPATPGEQGPK